MSSMSLGVDHTVDAARRQPERFGETVEEQGDEGTSLAWVSFEGKEEKIGRLSLQS